MKMEELIEKAKVLSECLKKASQDEINFHWSLKNILEMYSWELYKIANELAEFKEAMEESEESYVEQ